MGSFGVLAAALAHALDIVCYGFLSESYAFHEAMAVKYCYMTLFSLAMLRINGVSIGTAFPVLHAGRVLTSVMAAGALIYAGFKLPVGLASCCSYMSSVFVGALLLAYGAVSRNMPSPVRIGLILLGFAGICLVNQPFSEASFDKTALWIGVAGAFCSALAYLLLRRLGQLREPSSRTTFYFSAGAALCSCSYLLAADGFGAVRWSMFAEPLMLLSAFLGIAAQVGRAIGWGHGNPFINAVFNMTGLPFAFALGYLFFGQTHTLEAVAGVVLICLCALLSPLVNRR